MGDTFGYVHGRAFEEGLGYPDNLLKCVPVMV